MPRQLSTRTFLSAFRILFKKYAHHIFSSCRDVPLILLASLHCVQTILLAAAAPVKTFSILPALISTACMF